LGSVGDASAALEAIREALEFYRRLAATSPARYEPDIAMSLGAYGRHLVAAGNLPEAVVAIREGADILRHYAEEFPKGPAAQLLANLENDLKTVEKSIEEADDG